MGEEASGQIIELIDSIDLFVSGFDKFIGVFDEAYVGGDFCAGLTFGMHGTEMLQKVAVMMYDYHLKDLAVAARNKDN